MNEVTSTAVDFSPAITYALEAAAALVALALTWGITKLGKLLGVRQDQMHAGDIKQAIYNGLHLAIRENASRIKAAGMIDVKSVIIARAGQYAIDSYPDGAKKLGIKKPGDLADYIWAQALSMENYVIGPSPMVGQPAPGPSIG